MNSALKSLVSLVLVASATTAAGCWRSEQDATPSEPPAGSPSAVAPPASSSPRRNPTPSPPRVGVERLAVPGDQDVFALRGSDPSRKTAGVFLHGWCGHGLGYLQAFQFAAAESGRYLALQGDLRCGNTKKRAWSMNPDATDRRIQRALEIYLGSEVPAELLLGGSSQGVQVAVELARRFPERYRWLVLLSPSKELPVRGLKSLRGAYFLVGEHENQWPAKAMVQTWGQAGIPVTLTVIEDGGHADFHGRGDALMRQAFRQLGQGAPSSDGSPPSD